ncbi:MAG: TetR/AcrR family transcriptional regulator [Deltaproteobacteria bacterium]|nr:TetR/AcrR family transcriptional regulator [Deltaproteobacteria bacterium]
MASSYNDNKEKLLNVAIDLFATKGFKGTSIRDIARAMGMSISNIYHYFGNKEGLLLAILQRSSQGLVEGLHQISKQDLDPLERFNLLLKAHFSLSVHRRKESKIFFLDEEDLAPEGNKINRRIQLEVLDIYLKELRDLEAAGYVKCRSLKVLAFNIFGVINWYMRWYRPEGPLSQEETAEEAISFILHGMLGGSTQMARGG